MARIREFRLFSKGRAHLHLYHDVAVGCSRVVSDQDRPRTAHEHIVSGDLIGPRFKGTNLATLTSDSTTSTGSVLGGHLLGASQSGIRDIALEFSNGPTINGAPEWRLAFDDVISVSTGCLPVLREGVWMFGWLASMRKIVEGLGLGLPIVMPGWAQRSLPDEHGNSVRHRAGNF